jgi:hypothetical protein
MASGCFGQPGPRRRRPTPPVLPANPKVSRGVRLLYLGGGPRRLRGPATDAVYHVSEHRRAFTVHAADAPALSRLRDVILAP